MVTKKSKGLGRGLDNLLGDEIPSLKLEEGAEIVKNISINLIQAGKYQPRSRMDEGALQELAESIRTQGIMQPILVRPIDDTRYEIIAGERRFRASQIAELKEVPVLIKNVPDDQAAIMALIENIQREDLNPIEEAQGVERLIKEFGLTHELAAHAIGRSRSATSNLLRLLNLVEPVQTMLLAGDLDMGHARALLAVDGATQIQLATQIITKRMTVRDAEKLVAKFNEEFSLTASKRDKHVHRDTQRFEEKLADYLGTPVGLKVQAKGKGQINISFSNWDHLSALLEKMGLSEAIKED